MQVSDINNIKIYSVTSASKSAIPEWMAQKNKKKLANDSSWINRIELIQDFEFPEASIKLKATADGQYLMGTGCYKPQIRVWEVGQMAMKFERHTDAENVNFEILSDDWQKSVHLQNDRNIEVHSHYGMHYRTRVPKFGRDLKYHFPSCDVYVVGASSEVWRLNLEQGCFLAGYNTELPEINTIQISPAHQLLGLGGSDGKMEFWDPRQKKRIGILDVTESIIKNIDVSLLDSTPEISSISFGSDGLVFMSGTSTGQIVSYDLRSPSPLFVKDHQYGFPIKSINFHNSGNVISADTKICKIWDKNNGKIFTSIEGSSDINDVCVYEDSGLIMFANEGVQVQSYYIPQLGPAPKWCPFLDNLTEELEENPNQSLYDDYKFVTRKELKNLELEHLVGTNLLKAYMHGFFVDFRLYEKAKAIANPFEFEEHRKRLVQEKMEEKRKSRISSLAKLPKVNKQIAQEFMDEDPKKKKHEILQDERFSGMFNDSDFQIDKLSHEYKIHHPSTTAKTKQKFEKVDDSDSDDDQIRFQKFKEPEFYQLKDGYNALKDRDESKLRTFSERLQEIQVDSDKTRNSTGNKSITFKSESGNKKRHRK